MLRSFLTCALITAIVGASSPAIAGQSRAVAKHAPIEVVRDKNGDPVRTRDGRFVSSNWSGYTLAKFQTGKNYTAAQATWTVPAVIFQGTFAVSSNWVGIGGFCKSTRCRKADRSLIQLGTAQEAIIGADAAYFAWYEMLPQASITTPLEVNPGDVITASLSCAGKCKSRQKWTLAMTDETTGHNWSQLVTYKSSKLSAEWIEEAPSDASGILPLADFGMTTFTQSTANNVMANLSAGDSIVLNDPNGQTSNVSALNSTLDGFNACFSPDSTLAPCPSP